MKTKLILVTFLFFSFHLNCFGQSQLFWLLDERHEGTRDLHHIKAAKKYLSTRNKKGKPSFYLSQEAFYNIQGRLLKYITYIPDFSVFTYKDARMIEEHEYDDQGRLARYTRKGKSDKSDKYYFYLMIVYEYDKFGNRTLETRYDQNHSITGVLEYRPVYHDPTSAARQNGALGVDSIANQIFASTTGSAPATTPKQRVQTYREVDAANRIQFEQTAMRNDHNQVTHLVTVDNVRKNKSITSFKYDEEGNEVEQVQINSKGKPIYKYSSSYNAKGLLSEVRVWRGRKKYPEQVIRYEYDYYQE